MQIFNKPNFNFMKYKYVAFGVSALIILIGWSNIFIGKGLNLGIDFAGGTLIRVMFQDETRTADVRAALSSANLGTPQIQAIEDEKREFQIRTLITLEGEETQEDLEAHEKMGNMVVDALRTEEERSAAARGLLDLNNLDETELKLLLEPPYPDDAETMSRAILGSRVEVKMFTDFNQLKTEAGLDDEAVAYIQGKTFLSKLIVLSKESVGPQIGKELRVRATQAAVWALIGMLIYIGLRFRFAFGVSAVLTLIHDVMFTVGIFSLTNRELNLPVIAAIMTIIGYSLNDTIVIFDRVRDNIKFLRKLKFESLLDASINQTLSRTVITSGTTFLTVVALFLFGGSVINDFAFTIMIGVVVGTYSSIYQSCSLLYFWNKFFKPKKGIGK
ncbi:MAG: protein translocase subunit SecF [Candidatus Aminicenantes bacterium]|nr:protein translocase subunit SecF [Candidatus Aminicenantes bacterium]